MENVLDDLRENKIAVSTPIVDALLDCWTRSGADRLGRPDRRRRRRGGPGHPALVTA
jgi:hypothetical protein